MANIENDGLIEVPDLTGIHLNNAIGYLNQIGLKIDSVMLEDNNKIQNNCISRQSLRPGESVQKGTGISLSLRGNNPIKYLPSIYQTNDEKNNNFLKNYLWIVSHIMNEITLKLDNLENYFNPLKAPTDFFNWLASWFAVDVNYSITEDKMRLLVREIVNIYQWRGTAIGLAKFLEIITGYKPSIYENYRPITEYVIKDDRVVEHFIVDEKNSKNYFTVHFHLSVKNFDIDLVRKINGIVKSEKPAHTEYYLSFEKDKPDEDNFGFYIGINDINNNTLR
jgi:phage tail-like protein